ncbi:MAG: hypothetical protein ACO2O6_01345 [Candidatus Hydrothermia bacterium]|jgi:hypothetical protein
MNEIIGRLIKRSVFYDEIIYIYSDFTTHLEKHYKIKLNTRYLTYLKKLVKEFINENRIENYQRGNNYLINENFEFNFQNENCIWKQKIYCYDLKSAYYNYFLKLFQNNKLIIKYFKMFLNDLYLSFKKKKSKKQLKLIALGMLFKELDTYIYEEWSENKFKFKGIIEVKNETALWNKIETDILNALKEVASKYLLNDWVLIWVDCIYTSKEIDNETLKKINDELVEKINSVIRLKKETYIIDKAISDKYIFIDNIQFAKSNFNLLDLSSYYNEEMITTDIRKFEAVIETNEIDIFTLFETGEVRYLTSEEIEFINEVKKYGKKL